MQKREELLDARGKLQLINTIPLAFSYMISMLTNWELDCEINDECIIKCNQYIIQKHYILYNYFRQTTRFFLYSKLNI